MHDILVAHNAVSVDDDLSTQDVLAQVDFVTGALDALGAAFRVMAVAETGVDYLSLGWLTHSAPATDHSCMARTMRPTARAPGTVTR